MSTLRELELQQTAPRLLELLRRQGFVSLSQFQSDAVEKGIMRGANELLMTYDYDEAYQIAEIALLNRVASDHRAKALVLCPNPHQAEKRFQSLRQKCIRLGIEANSVIRRRTALGRDWASGRVAVGTFTSMDIATRTHPEMLENVQCAVIDRLDLIGQPQLGATLETVLVTMMGSESAIQYIAICPPVADIDDLGEWLSAEIIEDKKAEVKLIFSVKAFEDVDESLADLTEFVHYRHGQVMILCPSITACENLAGSLSGIISNGKSTPLDLRLSPEHRDDLRNLAREVMGFYPACDMTVRLGRVISEGIAFLHEGVSKSQRRILSAAWEEGILSVIVMPTRFSIASGLRATVVFLMGVYMQEFGKELSQEDSVAMLSDWQLNDVLQAAGRRRLDNEAFGIVVVDTDSERVRVLTQYFTEDKVGNLVPRLGEVDSLMDDPENIQDLVLRQLCGISEGIDDPYSILSRTFWAATNRTVDITRVEPLSVDDESVKSIMSLRVTKSTARRAKEIPNSSVKLVSMTPSKIEGLVRSGSREIWHYVSLKSDEGVSCSCESWKYQGKKKHRLCKHLMKFSNFTLKNDETKPYASGIIHQALRGLEVVDELEKDGLISRDKEKQVRCTNMGQNVTILGVPVGDARSVMRALGRRSGKLENIILSVTVARTGLPRDVVRRVLQALPATKMEDLVHCQKDLPGIVENCVEELQYVNSILLRIMDGDNRRRLRRESLELDKNLIALLDNVKQPFYGAH